MTDSQLTIIISAIPSIVASITAAILAFAAWRKSLENGAKSDTIIQKAVEIHTLTNSSLSALASQLAVAQQKIDGLDKLVAQMTIAKVVADNAASAAAAATLSDRPLGSKTRQGDK
jgi:hypothetical protein